MPYWRISGVGQGFMVELLTKNLAGANLKKFVPAAPILLRNNNPEGFFCFLFEFIYKPAIIMDININKKYMTALNQIYKCNVCGNMVEVVHMGGRRVGLLRAADGTTF